MKGFLILCCCLYQWNAFAQQEIPWIPDNGNQTFTNPVIHADYSDPDAIRVGSDYYMIASSFNHVPGLPILHSKDLVNWNLIGYALSHLVPFEHFSKVQHGGGVWAPTLRFHQQKFYIFYPDPDFGIYKITAPNINGPWSAPKLVLGGKGLIDPCPLWDDNGKVYLAHAYAGSRAGIKSVLVVRELNSTADSVMDNGAIVYDGHGIDPTIEGPKFYKRNGYYYLFAPAGGVATGWQLVLRSKSVWGPYERKVVMDQGTSNINGPHQGAWINTPGGSDWFLHFQDKDAYGRVVHLQPMIWQHHWPVIGTNANKDGKGMPVMQHRKPVENAHIPITTPPVNDEFNGSKMGLQWQWQANPQPFWSFLYKGALRLYCMNLPQTAANIWDQPHLLLQKFPASAFVATTKIKFTPLNIGDRTGLVVFGTDYAALQLQKQQNGIQLNFLFCKNADKAMPEQSILLGLLKSNEIYLRVQVTEGAICTFSYSEDGLLFTKIDTPFIAKPGRWVGAKLGLFASKNGITNDSGFADIDWFRITK